MPHTYLKNWTSIYSNRVFLSEGVGITMYLLLSMLSDLLDSILYVTFELYQSLTSFLLLRPAHTVAIAIWLLHLITYSPEQGEGGRE